MTKLPRILYKYLRFSSNEHDHNTRHATEGRFTLPKVKTNMLKHTLVYRAMVTWNTLSGHIMQENGKNRFKTLLKNHLLAEELSGYADV